MTGLPKPDALVFLDAVGARPARHGRSARAQPLRADPALSVEVVEGENLSALDEAWRDLLRRADAPNAFMHPRLLRAAAPGCRVVALLAWRTGTGKRRLAGLWAFSVSRPRRSLLPIRVLRAPATEHAYLAAPVIDRGCLDAVLDAMLDAVAARPGLPNVLALEAMSREGATFEALMRVLAKRGSACCRMEARQRPKLASGLDGKSYFEKALSASSRKKLRQLRRRLGEKGRIRATVARSADDVRRAFEAFLALEAQGWKGRHGTALSGDPDQAGFARRTVSALAEAGDVSIHALELDGRPVSMQVVLHAGPAAFTWKTAYDETLGDCSPGMLLLEDYSTAFLADDAIEYVDSCAYDDTGYMAAWTERQAVADLWIDARRGGSVEFRAAARLQKAYLALRRTAKRACRRSAPAQTLMRMAASVRQRAARRAENAPAQTCFAPQSRG